MYRILHPLNNNVALVKNERQEELVVIGRGIAFNKKKGDIVQKANIDKIFRLRTEDSKENFMALLKDVPLDFITVTYELIDDLSQKYDYPVQEYIYVTLTDHIYCSYQMLKQGNYQESNLPDVSDRYTKAFQMAKEALTVYRQRLYPLFPEDEVTRIAYHFINAEGVMKSKLSEDINKTGTILRLVDEELKRNGIQRQSKNGNFYDRFMIHLTYFLDDINRSQGNQSELEGMEKHLKQVYPKAYSIGSRIYDIIAQETGMTLYPSERVYLILHIQRMM